MNYQTLKTEIRGQVAYCSLNRPEKRNALNELMLTELMDFFQKLAGEKMARVLVLRATGKVFSAGADLSVMRAVSGKNEKELRKEAELFFDCFDRLYKIPVPVICYASGAVFGGANGLLAASDFVLCDPETRFSFSEVKLGLLPATVAPFVIRRCGLINAKRLMLLAREFDAKEALEVGLTDMLCADEKADDYIHELTAQIMENAPGAVSETKGMLQKLANHQETGNIREFCAGLIATSRQSREAREGIEAFFNKTKPGWRIDQ